MAQPKKRNADTPQKHGKIGLVEAANNLQQPVILAAQNGAKIKDIPAQASPALSLQARLESDMALQIDSDSLRRWPSIYGLIMAFGFSLCAWYAVGSIINMIFS